MTCGKCGSETRIMTQITISAPSRFYGKFSKKNLASKEVELLGASWEGTDFICTNPKCGFVVDGFGSYIKKLEKEVKELREKLPSAS